MILLQKCHCKENVYDKKIAGTKIAFLITDYKDWRTIKNI